MKALLILLFLSYTTAQWLSECGRSKYPNPAPEQRSDKFDRIVGGWEARANEFPYQLSLRVFESHVCGAVVINSNWALSAAHCTPIGSFNGLIIVAGAHNRSNPLNNEQRSNILTVINHERYTNPLRHSNDISLLQLANSLELNDNVAAACSPRLTDYVNVIATSSGWGATVSGGPIPHVLRYTNVEIWSNSRCNASYPGSIDESMVCASTPGRDICQGDSGGPLAYNNNGRFEVVGLASWGRGCAEPGNPGVYARVASKLEWIRENTERRPIQIG
ncbi:DgyrCDS14860 [Dimorphilus gyrociliatus]|uniref:DgyrCDS14860 n=1 Tax=Dimorphilus gyrociliatus TaxID=2664684 RepID=A0A7I8WFC8_9ANNE|nr:DgyrCDS14860 [Dimorphilus gyrociliatus]